MLIETDVDLQPLNTLAATARAHHYTRVHDLAGIAEAVRYSREQQLPHLVLGGGSNIVLTGNCSGLVMQMAVHGVEAQTAGDAVRLRIGAGENWDTLVRECLGNGWYGLENLIAIPGSVGAAPMQNIGAYGVELSSVLDCVEGWDIDRGAARTLSRDDCQLAYRDSIFKHALRDRFVISHVQLRLSTVPAPNADYPALAQALPAGRAVTPELVAQTVAAVRAAKLPDPTDKPNVGSFFKNPLVAPEQYALLRDRYPELPAWPMVDGQVKLAAGWLVEKAGFKGVRENGVGVHEQQALVLVNYQRGSGRDVLLLAERVRAAVSAQFDVALEIEPRVY